MFDFILGLILGSFVGFTVFALVSVNKNNHD